MAPGTFSTGGKRFLPISSCSFPNSKQQEASISLNPGETGEQGEKFVSRKGFGWGQGSQVLVPAESRLERNSVAAFLLLLKNFLRNHAVNQESLVQCHGPAIIGALLHKVCEAPKNPHPTVLAVAKGLEVSPVARGRSLARCWT